jgi:alpha-D-ribose 1-methylphosphonate 5-triphosphate diphosphatase
MTPLETALLDGVTVVPGDGSPVIEDAVVRLDADGIVQSIEPGGSPARLVLAPPAVDLHLDVMTERRRPRAGVVLELEQTVATLDAELVASGIGTVCIAARFEDEPAKGVEMIDALALCETVEQLAPTLVCDWRVHARVEVTEDEGPAALEQALERTGRIALISVMDHSAERSRFSSYEAHRAFYSEDWGLPPDEVERILARKRAGAQGAAERRARIAAIAHDNAVVFATHDDRTVEDVRSAKALGAVIAEFPLSLDTARAARDLGLVTVLGAPNAVRGRSTAAGNVLVSDAVSANACDVLCSDYLPSALLRAPFALAERDGVPLADAVALTTTAPARALGFPPGVFAEGRPLDAVAILRTSTAAQAVAMWRDGGLIHLRQAAHHGRATPIRSARLAGRSPDRRARLAR